MSSTADSPGSLHVIVTTVVEEGGMRCDRPLLLHPLAGSTVLDVVLSAFREVAASTRTLIATPAYAAGVVSPRAGWTQIDVAATPGPSAEHPVRGAVHGRLGHVLIAQANALLSRDIPYALFSDHVKGGSPVTVAVAGPEGHDRNQAAAPLAEGRTALVFIDIEKLDGRAEWVEHVMPGGAIASPSCVVSACDHAGVSVSQVALRRSDCLFIATQHDLAQANASLRDRRNGELMAGGVTVVDPASTWVGLACTVGHSTVIHQNVSISGASHIGTGCEIQQGVRLVDAVIGDNVLIRAYSVVERSRVDTGATLGPFCHLRPDSLVERDAHVGNFVELKKTVLGAGAKAGHLTYLGDTTVGANANIGAGTITCNYDGVAKHQTTIGAGAFIGSDSQLVAPVRVGDGAFIAAGSTITSDVPDGALGITRATQITKEGWVDRRRTRTRQN